MMETKNYGLRKESIVLKDREHEMMMMIVGGVPYQCVTSNPFFFFLLPVEVEPIALLDELLVKV